MLLFLLFLTSVLSNSFVNYKYEWETLLHKSIRFNGVFSDEYIKRIAEPLLFNLNNIKLTEENILFETCYIFQKEHIILSCDNLHISYNSIRLFINNLK